MESTNILKKVKKKYFVEDILEDILVMFCSCLKTLKLSGLSRLQTIGSIKKIVTIVFTEGTQGQNASQRLHWNVRLDQEKVLVSQTWVFSSVVFFEAKSCCEINIKI